MSELRECPFCGLEVAEITNAKELEECRNFEDHENCPCFEDESNYCRLYTVVCNYHRGGCGCTSGWFTNAEQAIRRWNERGVSFR